MASPALDADFLSTNPNTLRSGGAGLWHHCANLPPVRPGQLWLVELPAAGALWPQEQSLVAAANVVIYDRALAPLVAAALPLGGYAEPAGTGTGDAATVERCRRFVRDGWSVVRLLDAGRAFARGERLRAFTGRFRVGGSHDCGSVEVFVAGSGSGYRAGVLPLDRIGAAAPAEGGSRLIALFPTTPGSAPALSAVVANGLAG